MTWDILNTVGRVLLMLLVIYKLTQFREMMIPLERFGLGMMGAGSLLTVTVIWDGPHSPFDGWAVTLLTLGVLVFIAGRTWRDRRHQKANEAQIALYQAHRTKRRDGS